jgi:drug/metabolite transporter (DMT)-like permease
MIPFRGKVLLMMLAVVLALSVGETLVARGMKQAGDAGEWRSQLRAALGNGHVLSGTVLLIISLALYATVLSQADFSFALPLTAASYPLGTLLARVYLHEEVTLVRWIGTLIITVGVAIVGFGDSGRRSDPAHQESQVLSKGRP